MSTAKELFDKGNKVKEIEWHGVTPDAAKAAYNVSEISQTETDSLIGTEMLIIGYTDRKGEMGDYCIFLFIPNVEPLEVRTFITGSKAFCERVKRSDLPVAGTLKQVESKTKGAKPYYTFE